jgi:outer membrane protein assembly factor BamB
MGIVPAGEYPASWSAESGEGILWKTKVPLSGNSSPIVWGDRVFLTGATRRDRKLFCFDRRTGALLWECKARTPAVWGEDAEVFEDTGLASPTPVTDGTRVYAFFGTAELVAADFSGRQVWARWFGQPESMYGLATSPLLHEGTLYLQLDQGGPEEGKSILYALDPAKGENLWKVARSVPNSWSSPIIATTPDGAELITCADPWVISYEPAAGAELWRASVLSGDVAPVPVYADGMVYTVTEYAKLAAIRTGGSDDVTKTNVAWTYDRDLPDVASPLADGRYVLMVNAAGTATCLKAKTGEVVWTREFEKGFWASPTLVGRTVYLFDKAGKGWTFELKDTCEPREAGPLGEPVVATPAFVDGRIYVRAKAHLFAVGNAE